MDGRTGVLPGRVPLTPSRMASQRLSKERRVRRRGEFQRVFESGTRLQGRYFTMLLLPNGRPSHRLGIVASRKLGDAVDRNRAKRLIREIFRRSVSTDGTSGVDAVVIARRELLTADFSKLTEDFRSVWRRGISRMTANGRR